MVRVEPIEALAIDLSGMAGARTPVWWQCATRGSASVTVLPVFRTILPEPWPLGPLLGLMAEVWASRGSSQPCGGHSHDKRRFRRRGGGCFHFKRQRPRL